MILTLIDAIACSCAGGKRLRRWALSIGPLFVVLVGTLFFTSPSAALAQEPLPISVEVEVGFDGNARIGSWTPVAVQMENHGSDFAGEVHALGMRDQSVRYVADIVLPKNSRKRLILYVPYLTPTPRLYVELVSGGKVMASLETRVNLVGETDLFVGVVGQRTGAWNLLSTLDLPGESREVVVAPISPDSFPQRTEGLEAFDVIVLGDADVQALSSEMLDALEGWVAGGGTLVLPGGPQEGANLKGLPEQLMPVVIVGSAELENTSALERLGQEPFPATFPLLVIASRAVAGRVLTQEGEVPLVVLSRYGQGGVLFLAFDPAAQPLAGWVGMPQMLRELLFQSLPPSLILSDQAQRGDPRGAMFQGGYSSYRAVSSLPALELPSINLLLGLIAGYIVLAGPVNYVALRRLRRPGLMWATIPVLVLLFSGSAYFLAVRAKGTDVQGSAVSVIQEANDTSWAQVRRMVGVVAPGQGDYRIVDSGRALVASWDGGGGRFGGSGRSSGDIGVKIRNVGERSELELLRMAKWTMRSHLNYGVQRVEEALSYNLYIDGRRLKGTVTNESPTALKQVLLFTGGPVEDFGALGPGDTAIVDIPLIASAGGQPGWREQLGQIGSSSSSDPNERRRQSQLQDLAEEALESFYADSPGGLSHPIVAWTDEIPMGITVNEVKPAGPSLTLFVKPVTPRIQGSFSLPGGLLLGRVVNVEGQVSGEGPGEVVLSSGSAITFQFELPKDVREIGRAALYVPFGGGSLPTAQSVEVLAYHWEDNTWEPRGLETGLPQTQSSPAGRPSSPYNAAYPQPGQGFAVFNLTHYGYELDQSLIRELFDDRGTASYVSPAGLVRIKLVIREGLVGAPSLILEGSARE